MQALAEDVKTSPDAYQFERAQRLKVSVRCVGYALKRLGISYKKVSIIPRSASENGIYSRKKLINIKKPGALLFISMKAALLMICRALMGMQKKGSVAMASKIGELREEPTLLGLC
ncbi:IS630 transposase-related protein [Candidatus Bealeia paramacronuclearis]